MSEHTAYTRDAELRELLTALVEGNLTDDQQSQLEELVASDDDARAFYVDVVALHAMLIAKGEPAFAAVSDQPLAISAQSVSRDVRHAPPEGDASDSAREASVLLPRSKSLLNRASRHPLIPSIGVAMVVLASFSHS